LTGAFSFFYTFLKISLSLTFATYFGIFGNKSGSPLYFLINTKRRFYQRKASPA
jgi:hypothetical protein